MYRAIVEIKGFAPYSQSHQHHAPKLEGESHEAYEARTWREKCNTDKEGNVVVPAMALKFSLDAAAKRAAIPDPDNRRANMTKYFLSDVLCEAAMPIGIKKEDIQCITFPGNVDGVRGSGKRVTKYVPQTPTWGGTATFLVMEEKINKDILQRVLNLAGRSVGVGQFRPQVGGLNGRFEATIKKIEKLD